MKKILIIGVLSLIQLFAFSQKNLSLEEAVRQQFGKFYPEHLMGLQWLPNSNEYIFQKGDTLYKGNAESKAKVWLTAKDIQSATLELKSLPELHWTDSNLSLIHI